MACVGRQIAAMPLVRWRRYVKTGFVSRCGGCGVRFFCLIALPIVPWPFHLPLSAL
ncbi:hypothetical protein K450DRAFT_248953 [Umbelopsis ramanniana AG]|uniref:Uncharacterized protein n=1 Tax=Umbelopsis ramanniana AG TaxID=1314678 RepID=A0AAD5HBJ7_UMBRA|nr:uncharacterized protein K450DRAFT_248953 [Umbelopsis ramanniana AG]KAI8578087.1 hypothetical protein K450DRAFT_248953 [Umbelopsis ramanniana AG]